MKAITDPPAPWWKRLAWFAGIWAVSVAALGALSFMLRLWIA